MLLRSGDDLVRRPDGFPAADATNVEESGFHTAIMPRPQPRRQPRFRKGSGTYAASADRQPSGSSALTTGSSIASQAR